MDRDTYNEYVRVTNTINITGYLNIDKDEVNKLIKKLKSDIIYAHCLNGLYVTLARAYINYLSYTGIIATCPGSAAIWLIQQFDPPNYLDALTIRNLLFRDYYITKYCMCGKLDCQFKPPYPVVFPLYDI
jgi:hypothetical protein